MNYTHNIKSKSYVNHVLELLLRGVVTQGPHDGAQLLGGHRPVPVLVEHHEGLLEGVHLLVRQLDRVLVPCDTPSGWKTSTTVTK